MHKFALIIIFSLITLPGLDSAAMSDKDGPQIVKGMALVKIKTLLSRLEGSELPRERFETLQKISIHLHALFYGAKLKEDHQRLTVEQRIELFVAHQTLVDLGALRLNESDLNATKICKLSDAENKELEEILTRPPSQSQSLDRASELILLRWSSLCLPGSGQLK